MPVVSAGSINLTALQVPNIEVQIVPPGTLLLNGVPSNILGLVGTASWGPVNSPVIGGGFPDYTAVFGLPKARKFDLGTQVQLAALQGASNFRFVRVTDGTDTAATAVVGATDITYSSKYTGTGGNTTTVTQSVGSKAGTVRVVVAKPGLVPEVFDNIGFGLTGAALWAAIASAVNNGVSGQRGPSQIITAAVPASTPGTDAFTPSTLTLAGGTDGAGVTATALVGLDTTPRTGMYALRSTGASIIVLCDVDDPATWGVQAAYGLSEGAYAVVCGPFGDTISNAVSAKAGVGLDTYAVKPLFGDYIYFVDTANGGALRLTSPCGVVAGKMANQSPEQSPLNKPLVGIVGTQASFAQKVYSDAELAVLAGAGIDIVTNPNPGGRYFGVRLGVNASSDARVNGDNYTRLTNYIAQTLNNGMGIYIGELGTPESLAQSKATLDAFMKAMQGVGQVQDFKVTCDASNNPPDRLALGYRTANVMVRYFSITKFFIVNLEAGQTVTVVQAAN